ncbi:MAG TPA: P-loop NTPase [Coriobacteriaceae bacterium]|nr:P-loop NTPase [Coriobacteriaceae bacterium]
MKAIWLACCACGDYGLLQQEVEGRDAGAQVLRVGDLDGLVSMARAFPSRRGAAIIAASLFDTEDVRKTVARLTAEGRVSRVVVLIETLDPSDIEGLFRAGATEVIAAHSLCGNGRAGEGTVDSDRRRTIEPDAFVDREPGAPRATRGPRVDEYGKAEAEHGRRPRDPLAYDDAGGPVPYGDDALAEDMGYVHGVNLADELDEVEGFAGAGEPCAAASLASEPQPRQPAMPAWARHVTAAGETGMLSPASVSPVPAPSAPALSADASIPSRRAPVVCAVSGSGGCGKSTIVATMAHAASLLGLRAAVLDLDLMFGNLYDLLGVDAPHDMATLIEPSAAGALAESDIVAASMRVAPGVTLWGPVAAPEKAELMARPVELLLDVLRRESDVVFVDTSVFWGDAVAAAVAASDRCLVVGDAAVSSATSASRVIELASRVGVPRTRMSAVFNRFGARGADEDVAMRFEIACALSSKIRIADGGQDLAALMAFGRADEAVGQTSAFATSVREATREMLVELGCAVGPWSDMVADRAIRTERPRIRLPWSREGDAR